MARNRRRNRRNSSGGSQTANRSATVRNANHDTTEDRSSGTATVRSSTETKSSLKTTELIAYAGAVLAVIMTALAVDAGEEGGDPFGAEPAIRYITYLTIGYMIARGLAKSGSHENRIEGDSDSDDDGDRTSANHDGDARRDERDDRDDARDEDDDDTREGDVETLDDDDRDDDDLTSGDPERVGAGTTDSNR